MKIRTFWDVAPCRLGVDQRFRGSVLPSSGRCVVRIDKYVCPHGYCSTIKTSLLCLYKLLVRRS